MTAALTASAFALLLGLGALRWLTGGRGRGAITAADLALLLSCAEIVQLLATLTKIDTQLHWDASLLPAYCLVGLTLAVLGSFADWIATVVTALGVGAAMVDTFLTDGPSIAALLTVTVLLVWLVNRREEWLP